MPSVSMEKKATFLDPALVIKHNLERIFTEKASSRKKRPVKLQRRVKHLEGSFDEREMVRPHILQMSLNSATWLNVRYWLSPSLSIRFRCFSFLSLAPSLSSFFLFPQPRLPSFPFPSQTWLRVGVFYGSFSKNVLKHLRNEGGGFLRLFVRNAQCALPHW